MINFNWTPEQYQAHLQRRIQSDIKNALTTAYCGYKADKARTKGGTKVSTSGSGCTKVSTNKSAKAPAAARHPEQVKLRDIEQRYRQMMADSAERRRKATDEAKKKYESVYPFYVSPGLTSDELDIYTEYCVALGAQMKQINAERTARQREQARKGR